MRLSTLQNRQFPPGSRSAAAGGRPPGFPWRLQRGFTLLEVVTVITLLGLLLGRALPAVDRLRDRMAVVGAREAVMGLLERARMEAVARGGATLVFSADDGAVSLLSVDTVLAAERLSETRKVAVVLGGDRPEATLRFDAMGLGRVASQSIRFSRGEEACGLVISSYGRVVRW